MLLGPSIYGNNSPQHQSSTMKTTLNSLTHPLPPPSYTHDDVIEVAAEAQLKIVHENEKSTISASHVLTAPRDPSTSVIACSKLRQTSNKPIDKSEEAVLLDLWHYVPLGCLHIGAGYSSQDFDGGEFAKVKFLSESELGQGPRGIERLLGHRLISVFRRVREDGTGTLRIYALPWDRARGIVQRRAARQNEQAKYFMDLLKVIDPSPDAWNGHRPANPQVTYQYGSSNDDDSLFYIFNTIPSPTSSIPSLSCPYSSGAVEALYDDSIPGLRTQLYAYQKRTAASMIRREAQPGSMLDPRLQAMRGPTGATFYLDCQKGVHFLDRREYDEARGGILGESMGLGKTLIALAIILATRGHWPSIPPESSIDLHPTREQPASLTQTAATAASVFGIPWKPYFAGNTTKGGRYGRCYAHLRNNRATFIQHQKQRRYNERSSAVTEGRMMRLSDVTLIVVPENLLSQWQSEIRKHVEEGALDVLCLDTARGVPLPCTDDLLDYDVILMTRQRLTRELNDQSWIRQERWQKGPRSPLLQLYFLRVILDEGHNFTAKRTQINSALSQLHVERRWIVSGTPTNGLIGVELGAAVTSASCQGDEDQPADANSVAILTKRRKEAAFEQELQDIKALGTLCQDFLKLRPWANQKDDDPADWNDYIRPSNDGRRKPLSLRALLESLVVRHRIDDIQSDLQLPPLYNKTVYLQPSWFDKININIFILVLTVNAVTSEREDRDYMFHPQNRDTLQELIRNMRHAAFYWTGHTPRSIEQTIHVAENYLSEHEFSTEDQLADQRLLKNAVSVGQIVLSCRSWESLSKLHEMGIFVEGFPARSQAWSVTEGNPSKFMLSVTSALSTAQDWINSHLYMDQYEDQLGKKGKDTFDELWAPTLLQRSDPISAISVETGHAAINRSPRQSKKSDPASKVTGSLSVSKARALPNPTHISEDTPTVAKSILKRPAPSSYNSMLPPSDARLTSRIIGTVSAKLSYLLDRLSDLQSTEKSLVFFEDDNIAVYISQALDLLAIPYLIYASTLLQARKTAYIHTFNSTPHFRVLIMNVSQAAHGLHIAAASRVFFVNPVWQPHIEAQAIKRAHRIGQTRPVYVETLVLKDTLEDYMQQRSKHMQAQEHQKAQQSPLDDKNMSEIIKNANFIPFLDKEIHETENQIARLRIPQQLFARQNRTTRDPDDPDADLIFPNDIPRSKRKFGRTGSIL